MKLSELILNPTFFLRIKLSSDIISMKKEGKYYVKKQNGICM